MLDYRGNRYFVPGAQLENMRPELESNYGARARKTVIGSWRFLENCEPWVGSDLFKLTGHASTAGLALRLVRRSKLDIFTRFQLYANHGRMNGSERTNAEVAFVCRWGPLGIFGDGKQHGRLCRKEHVSFGGECEK
jgi:hypothetical protein